MDQGAHNKINVLELNSSFAYAGGARNLYSFCQYLDKNIFNVWAASHANGGSGEEILKSQGVEYILGKGDPFKIVNFIKDKKIDILHFHRSGQYIPVESKIINLAKEAFPNLIIIERNVFGKFDPSCNEKIDCHLFQSMMHLHERFLPLAKEVFDFKKMQVMYNMVNVEDFEKYRLDKEKIKEYKALLGIRETDFVIGKIARPHIAKWSDLVLEMMPYLVKDVPNLKFIIMGVPKSRIEVINRSKLKAHYILLNETTDESIIHKFYQTIDVLAHSSKIGECNGNTINEAMFWGKPVVVNSTPRRDNGQLEQLTHMKDGIVANHPQTFARAIAYLCNDEVARKEMGEKARKRILFFNNPNKVIKQLEAVFIERFNKIGGLFYGNVLERSLYYPNEEGISNYPVEYHRRLIWDFGVLSVWEKVVNFFKKPKYIYYKIKDFLEDKHVLNYE